MVAGRWWIAAALLGAGCAGSQAAPATGRTAVEEGETIRAAAGLERFVDARAGFEIARPLGDAWQFAPGHAAPEGILVPVVVLHPATGAQVVVQVTPDVATPQEFAERLAVGLRSKPGFSTTVPTLSGDGRRSGFSFSLAEEVFGRVGILDAGDGRLFVLLATWPSSAPDSIIGDVETIMSSLRPFSVRTALLAR